MPLDAHKKVYAPEIVFAAYTGWQTMESAPKDGKPFVAWSVTIMDSFDEDDRLIERGVRVEAPCIVYWFSIQGLPGGQFVESPYRSHVSNREFTHWLPLPPSPIPSPSGQEGGDV
jgi:hypothetical protein